MEITSSSRLSKHLLDRIFLGQRRARNRRREGRAAGNTTSVAETTTAESAHPGEPEVAHSLDAGTARITVRGELTETARRPLVRSLTDLLLGHEPLQRAELHLAGVSFMNTAG